MLFPPNTHYVSCPRFLRCDHAKNGTLPLSWCESDPPPDPADYDEEAFDVVRREMESNSDVRGDYG